MSPRSLFNIILKILGIYLVKDILVTIPTLLSFTSMFISGSGDFNTIAMLILILLFYGWICHMLIFRTEWVINVFRLDSHFKEDTLVVHMHRSSILRIAVTVIGGIIVIEAIPEICDALIGYWYQKDHNEMFNSTYVVLTQVLIPIVKFLIGIFLLTNTRWVVNVIELKRRE